MRSVYDNRKKAKLKKSIQSFLKNGSAKFKMFRGCNSKELYHYLDPTLENPYFGDAVIHVGANGINNRDSSKSLQRLENLKKIAEKCFSYGIEKSVYF